MFVSKYEIEKDGIVYIIPDDELYRKYVNDEAFIDIPTKQFRKVLEKQ